MGSIYVFQDFDEKVPCPDDETGCFDTTFIISPGWGRMGLVKSQMTLDSRQTHETLRGAETLKGDSRR